MIGLACGSRQVLVSAGVTECNITRSVRDSEDIRKGGHVSKVYNCRDLSEMLYNVCIIRMHLFIELNVV